jgi:hypothetical protein
MHTSKIRAGPTIIHRSAHAASEHCWSWSASSTSLVVKQLFDNDDGAEPLFARRVLNPSHLASRWVVLSTAVNAAMALFSSRTTLLASDVSTSNAPDAKSVGTNALVVIDNARPPEFLHKVRLRRVKPQQVHRDNSMHTQGPFHRRRMGLASRMVVPGARTKAVNTQGEGSSTLQHLLLPPSYLFVRSGDTTLRSTGDARREVGRRFLGSSKLAFSEHCSPN